MKILARPASTVSTKIIQQSDQPRERVFGAVDAAFKTEQKPFVVPRSLRTGGNGRRSGVLVTWIGFGFESRAFSSEVVPSASRKRVKFKKS
jgi:hypothetical protein